MTGSAPPRGVAASTFSGGVAASTVSGGASMTSRGGSAPVSGETVVGGGTAPPAEVLWNAVAAAAATGGRAVGDWIATGVSIDSRTVGPGDLFVALHGPSYDGHAFVSDALRAGAAAVCVSGSHRPVAVFGAGAALVAFEWPMLEVADTTAALAALGAAARNRCQATVIAVTGSVGKTGTKEAIAHCLAGEGWAGTGGGADGTGAGMGTGTGTGAGTVYATKGNLNNHIGVPLSLARLPAGARFAVFELGMNHAGELGPLARQVRPAVAVVTNVEPVHLAHFASVEAIADAKAELFEGVGPAGCAVLPADSPHFARLKAAASVRGVGRVLSFGTAPGADVRLGTVSAGADGSTVEAEVLGRRVGYRIGIAGRHWVINSLAVLAAVTAAGADVGAAAARMATLVPVKGRGARRTIPLPGGSLVLIDESYNASPVATRAALEVLGAITPAPGGRRIAVLGDMLELGDAAVSLHADLAASLLAFGVDRLLCCGPLMRALFDAVAPSRRGLWVPDSRALAPLAAAMVRPGDVVLVKGSAGSRMGAVIDALMALGAGGRGLPAQGAAGPNSPARRAGGPER